MKRLSLCLAALLLAACASGSPFARAPRHDWRCDGGRAFSIRIVESRAELFAAGRVHRLRRTGAGFSDGQVEFSEQGGRATLTGAFGGPYENCRED